MNLKRLLPIYFALASSIAFTGCDMTDDEVMEVIKINFVEGDWSFTNMTYVRYANNVILEEEGEEEEPNVKVTFAGGKLVTEGDSDVAEYTLSKVDDKDYIHITENGKNKGTYLITKLTSTDMEWVIDKTEVVDGRTDRHVTTYKFKRIGTLMGL